MADTAYDLLVEALTDLGVLAEGETPSASQAQGALSKLNSMLDAWNIEGNSVYGETGQVFPLVAGQATYTMGIGGNFNVARPADISAIYLRQNNVLPAYALDIPLWIATNKQYQQIGLKGMTGSQPVTAWVNNTAPLLTITLNPVPDASTPYNLVVWTTGALGGFTLNQLVNLAPGYREAVVANLVLRLAPGYAPLQPSQLTQQLAISGKATIQAKNTQIDVLRIDRNLTGMPYPTNVFIAGAW